MITISEKKKMEDQLERDNSPQAFDAEDGDGSSNTETNSAILERLREILKQCESTIEDLRQTVATLKHNIEEQCDEIVRLKNLNSNTHKPNRSATVIEVAETMTNMEHLSHLTLARAFLKSFKEQCL
uniref:Bm9501 n=1 Tax=Brugia malayi TaxID=6279 RepID=A0A0I9N7M2_BRUMA|nr:Bm9501 [Brugia malayi]